MLRAKLARTLALAAFALVILKPLEAQTVTETVLHNFASIPANGANPYTALLRDSAGNLYGTTVYGGPANSGVVFKINTAGQESVLYSFTGGTDGWQPSSAVIMDAGGNLYGVTVSGGSKHSGVVYEVSATGVETVLYNFTGGSDGWRPGSALLMDSSGNLYGTTFAGGSFGYGVVYELSAAGVETVLYNFTGGSDGASPNGGVIMDSTGCLYGTTYSGGAGFAGVLYKLTSAGQETILYHFNDKSDGGFPYGGVIMDSGGNFYGTTSSGGTANEGVVYKVTPSGLETVLYSFMGGADGGSPYSGVLSDSSGNLYGTTFSGGSANVGVVYKLNTAGKEAVVYSFSGGSDGASPYAGMIADGSGNLYGTTTGNTGAVFKISSTGAESVVYGFPGGTGGSTPESGLFMDSAGDLYGTASSGGPDGDGVIYKVTPSQTETVVYGFPGGANGRTPLSSLARDSAGNFYGTTSGGGIANEGIVYKVTGGVESVLYSFTGGFDGGQPSTGVILDTFGNLYGTTTHGGLFGYGVVYEVSAFGQETVLYAFTGWGDGACPYSGVIRDSAGNLYGTTAYGGLGGRGVVYKLGTNGQETVLYWFTGGFDGSEPYSGLIMDSGGNLYGTTQFGGLWTEGVVYKVTSAGFESVLYAFTGGTDGDQPQASLVRDSSGNLYGTTLYGGKTGWGTVYKLTSAGKETVLHSFTGGTDGSEPFAGLIRDSSGNLYGTTIGGGTSGSGVLFEISVTSPK